jgi:hypothetical protein
MRARGFTFISFLVIVGIAAGVVWLITYGPAYIERYEVHSIVREAANYCYREKDDEKIKGFIINRVGQSFSEEVMDHGRKEMVLKFDFSPRDDLRIDRTETPPEVNIWLTYRRTVTVPLAGYRREVEFTVHAGQDLTPVKW